MKFNKLDVPHQWKEYFTKYPHGYTIFEALCTWTTQVDNMVDNQNNWNDYLDNFVEHFEFDLQKEVKETITKWRNDGLLDIIIESALNIGFDNFNTQLAETDDRLNGKIATAFSELELSKINKDVGDVEPDDLSQEVKEIINGDRPLPVAEVDSILTENIVDKQVTRDKLSDDFTHKLPWIEDEDASLDMIYKSGTYIIDGKVKASPHNLMGVLDVVASRTTESTVIYRVIQIMYALNGRNIYYRGFSIDTSSGAFVGEPTEWLSMLDQRTNISDFKGFTSKGIISDVNIDTLTDEGTYFIGSSVEGNPYRSSILTIEKVYANNSPTESTNFWGIQRVTSVDSPNKISVRYFRSLTSVLEFYEWYEVASDSQLPSYEVGSIWEGKRYVGFGTSLMGNDGISDGRGGFASYTSQILGTNFENRGQGSGGITTTASAGDTTMQRVKELASQPDDIDLITVEVGANDFGAPLGEFGDTTQDTWYGALYMVCDELTKNTTARSVLITSTPARSSVGEGGTTRTPKQIFDINHTRHKAVEEVGAMFSIPVINVNKGSALGGNFVNDQTYVDHIHLSELGAKMVGEYVAMQLLQINPMPAELQLPTLNE